MRVNGTVTVFRLSQDGTEYVASGVYPCFYRHERGVQSEKSGLSDSESVTVRIPGVNEIGIELGDYIGIGSCRVIFDRQSCFRVCGIYDNRIGANPHWRLVAQ